MKAKDYQVYTVMNHNLKDFEISSLHKPTGDPIKI